MKTSGFDYGSFPSGMKSSFALSFQSSCLRSEQLDRCAWGSGKAAPLVRELAAAAGRWQLLELLTELAFPSVSWLQ